MSSEIVGCQFSVYPLRQADIDTPGAGRHQGGGSEGCARCGWGT